MKTYTDRICNAPKDGEAGKRIIGFVLDSEMIPILGLFDDQLEEACKEFLTKRGYTIYPNN